jgi:hypothetical protein
MLNSFDEYLMARSKYIWSQITYVDTLGLIKI